MSVLDSYRDPSGYELFNLSAKPALAAALILALEPAEARSVIRALGTHGLKRVLPILREAGQEAVFADLVRGLESEVTLLELLDARYSAEATRPFDWLDVGLAVNPGRIVLSDATAEDLALAVIYLGPAEAGALLDSLPDERAIAVLEAVARVSRLGPAEIAAAEWRIKRQLELQRERFEGESGHLKVAALLNSMGWAKSDRVLAGLRASSPELVDQVRTFMFLFEDVATLAPGAIRRLSLEVDPHVLATALSGATEGVRDAIIGAQATVAEARGLEELVRSAGASSEKAVAEAQLAVIDAARRLEEMGQIEIRPMAIERRRTHILEACTCMPEFVGKREGPFRLTGDDQNPVINGGPRSVGPGRPMLLLLLAFAVIAHGRGWLSISFPGVIDLPASDADRFVLWQLLDAIDRDTVEALLEPGLADSSVSPQAFRAIQLLVEGASLAEFKSAFEIELEFAPEGPTA